jgi:hypothetical protein
VTEERQSTLSDEARKQRRNLLLASAVGIALVKLGIVPTKISALGVTLDPGERKNLLTGLFVIVLFFLVDFVAYAFTDLVAWMPYSRPDFRREITERRLRKAYESAQGAESEDEFIELEAKRMEEEFNDLMRSRLRRASLPRAVLDFAFPGIFAIYALSELAFTAW